MSSDSSSQELLRLRFGAFELDEADARLTRDGQPIPLAPRPFAVLCALARSPRTLVTKDALLDSVWGHRFVSESVLKTTVSALRAALDDDPKQPQYIETVSRRGYRFIAAPSVLAAPAVPVARSTPSLAGPAPTASASSIIGRADGLEQLRAAWQHAREGKRRIVWVAGEPGVGKTTLIGHFVAEAGESASAHGQCVEQAGAGEPYLPVLEALSALCRRDPPFVELMRTIAPTWLLQLPWLCTADEREGLRRELAGSGQARMLRELGELLERYTETTPLLLVTEDLHWSDRATLQLIDYLARRRGPARLMWLASLRLTEIVAVDHPLKPLRHELKLHGLSEEIVLEAFSELEVADYVAGRMPELAADETFVRALHARTDGLPLFVADVVSDLLARGEIAPDSASSAVSRLEAIDLPENLAGIVEQYLYRLAPEERALLEAASVCGLEFRIATVADVLERDVSAVARCCTELARAQRWLIEVPLETGSTSDTRYAFRHALYREVLHDRLGAVARAGLHRRIALALERERREGAAVSAAELASHFDLGHDSAAAVRYYAEAAEAALQQFSPVRAIDLAERALALLERAHEGRERTYMELTLATVRGAAAIQAHGISSAQVKASLERAQSLLDAAPDHPLRGLLLQPLGVALYMRGELDSAESLARRTEALAAATGDRIIELCASSTHGIVQYLRGRPRAARGWFEKALSLCGKLDASEVHAMSVADPAVIVLGLLGLDLLHLGMVEEGRARIAEARARADELRAPAPRTAALWVDAMFEVRLGNASRVAAIADELQAVDETSVIAEARAAGLWFRGWAQAQTGDPRGGYELIREGFDLAVQLGTRAWAGETLGYGAEALAIAGDWTAARREIDEALRCAESIGERQYLPQLLVLDARIADALGEHERAREAGRKAVDEAHAQDAPWLQLIALTALCELEGATARDRASLRSALDRLTEGLDTAAVASARALLRKIRRP